MPIENANGSFMITGKGIDIYKLLALRSALSLECEGISIRRGFSAFAIVKKEYGLKGNKKKVFEQFDAIVEKARAEYKND